ncbi:MAG TPA: DUF2378 family protein [Vicinamibacteria bacterium]|nr:DUF2378 family protein [Vicinamibacteria bacterium]
MTRRRPSSVKVKGSVLRARLAFVEQQAGAEGVTRVKARLQASERADLERLLPTGWYSFDLGRHLDEAIVEELGGGRQEYFLRLGEASAERNLGGVHRAFLKPGDPHAFLAQAPEIYAFYYDRGHRTYEATGAREGVLTTHEADTFSGPDCLTVVGWHVKALQMCGASGVSVVEEECRARGGAVCRYRVRWA